jgi:2-oxoisovalerate dehydrogenase E1 component alpha subunit
VGKQVLPHERAGLPAERIRQIYQTMVVSRVLDQRWWQLNRQGKASIVASSQGHEAAQLGALAAFDKATDLFFLTYRSMTGYLGMGLTPKDLLLSFLAKRDDPFSGGRQFPMHGALLDRRIFNLSNVVSAQIPKAVGAALAVKLRNEKAVVYSTFGDGATSQGEWHESLNFAGVHRLPVVFVCENNHYAISVPQSLQMAVEDVSVRAQGYGFPGVTVDGCDLFAVYAAAKDAVARARTGNGPTLLECKVERLMAHTSDDDDRRYRSEAERKAMQLRDPVTKLKSYLLENRLLTQSQEKALWEEAQATVDRATDEAEKAPLPDDATLLRHVYDEGT